MINITGKRVEAACVRSACCQANWVCVLLEDGTGDLQCVECGMSIGPGIKVTHTMELICAECGCDVCREGGDCDD